MNYSQEWQDKLNYYNGLEQTSTWETLIAKGYVDLNDSKATNIIFLKKPVWVEIHDMVGSRPFRKIKAISKYNAYFDGFYDGLGYSPGLGCLHKWDYTIDGHKLDLNNARAQDNNQEKLLEFLRLYSDSFIPQVPKGILKIPSSF